MHGLPVLFFLCCAQQSPDLDKEEEEVLRAFRLLAERIAEFPGFHLEFSVAYVDTDPHRQQEPNHHEMTNYLGTFDFDAIGGKAYLETVRLPRGAEKARKDYYSWNGSFGMHKIEDANRPDLHVNAFRSPLPPPGMGRAHLPSCFIYYPALTSLASYLENHRIVVDSLPDGRYRIAVAQGEPNLEIPPSWRILYVRRDGEEHPRIEEERLYFFRLPEKGGRPLVNEETALPPEFALPEKFRVSFLHLRKIYEKYTLLDGIPFPTRWRVLIHHGGVEAVVEIDERSLRAEPDTEHGFRVPLESDDVVFNTAERLTYQGSSSEHDFGEEGMVTEAQLVELLQEAGATFTKGASKMADAYVPIGCAADCMYMVLSTLGRPYPLHRIVSELGIRPGSPRTDLETVCEFLERRSVEHLAIEGDAPALEKVLRRVENVPVVLHTEGGREGHFFPVRAYQPEDDTVQVLDTRHGPFRLGVRELEKACSGVMLLLDPEIIEGSLELLGSPPRRRYLLIAALSSGSLAMAAFLWLRKRKR